MKKNLTWKAFGLICALGALTLVGCGSDTKTELIPINGGGDPTPEKEVNATAAVVTYDVTAPATLMATLEKVGKQTLVRYVDASGTVKEETFTGSFKKTVEIPVTSEGVEMAYEVLLLPKTQDELKALGADQNLDFTGMGTMKFFLKYDDGTKSDEFSAEEVGVLKYTSMKCTDAEKLASDFTRYVDRFGGFPLFAVCVSYTKNSSGSYNVNNSAPAFWREHAYVE